MLQSSRWWGILKRSSGSGRRTSFIRTLASVPSGTLGCISELEGKDVLRVYTRVSPLAVKAKETHDELCKLRNEGPLGPQQVIALRQSEPLARHTTAIERLQNELADVKAIMEDPQSDEDMKELAREEETCLLHKTEEIAAHAVWELITSLDNQAMDDSDVQTDEYNANTETNAILEIRAGTGGDEAALFVGDLLGIYEKFAARQRWKVRVLSLSSTNIGGIREIILRISGHNVYDTLRQEAGVHRVQRVPATEGQGRIHTSTASVAVLRDDTKASRKVDINEGDIKVDVYRASGAGGQHVNKTESAVRVTHIPTGLIATSQEDRSQHRNRAIALESLAARIAAKQAADYASARATERRAQLGSMAGERSDRIRTYNYPQKRVTDHRIVPDAGLISLVPSAKGVVGDKSAPLSAVLEGGAELERLMDSVKRAMELESLLVLLNLADKDLAERSKGGKRRGMAEGSKRGKQKVAA